MSRVTTYSRFAAGAFSGQLGAQAYNDTFVNALNAFMTSLESDFNTLLLRSLFPELEWIDGGAFAASGGDVVIRGSGFLQNGDLTFDSLAMSEGSADLTLHALTPGDSGINVKMTLGGGALAVTYDTGTKLLTITLASGGSTDDAIATAINADASEANGYVRADSGGGGSFTVSQNQQAMTGGQGVWTRTKVIVSGVDCLPANETGATSTAKWADDAITFTVPDLTSESPARAASDIAAVKVMANGVMSLPIGVVLT